jgi:hypothetical protein
VVHLLHEVMEIVIATVNADLEDFCEGLESSFFQNFRRERLY